MTEQSNFKVVTKDSTTINYPLPIVLMAGMALLMFAFTIGTVLAASHEAHKVKCEQSK